MGTDVLLSDHRLGQIALCEQGVSGTPQDRLTAFAHCTVSVSLLVSSVDIIGDTQCASPLSSEPSVDPASHGKPGVITE